MTHRVMRDQIRENTTQRIHKILNGSALSGVDREALVAYAAVLQAAAIDEIADGGIQIDALGDVATAIGQAGSEIAASNS